MAVKHGQKLSLADFVWVSTVREFISVLVVVDASEAGRIED